MPIDRSDFNHIKLKQIILDSCKEYITAFESPHAVINFFSSFGKVNGIARAKRVESYANSLKDDDVSGLLVLARALFDTTSKNLTLRIANKAIQGEAWRTPILTYGSLVGAWRHTCNISTEIFPNEVLKQECVSSNLYQRRDDHGLDFLDKIYAMRCMLFKITLTTAERLSFEQCLNELNGLAPQKVITSPSML